MTPLDTSAFLDELEKLCRKLGIETKVVDDQRVYCLNVPWLRENDESDIRLRAICGGDG